MPRVPAKMKVLLILGETVWKIEIKVFSSLLDFTEKLQLVSDILWVIAGPFKWIFIFKFGRHGRYVRWKILQKVRKKDKDRFKFSLRLHAFSEIDKILETDTHKEIQYRQIKLSRIIHAFLIRKPFFCLRLNFFNIMLEIRLRFL